jgi:endoglycosylceramidase
MQFRGALAHTGDAVKDPFLMVPGVADRVNLQPVYERVASAIRAVAPALPIFFESVWVAPFGARVSLVSCKDLMARATQVTWDDVLVGFTQSPGGVAWRNKSVLAYHW